MISILMPIYNGIEFIDESVSSILNQTHKEWELIIGINGHFENSDVYKTAKKYEEIDNRIKVLDLYLLKGKSNALNEMVNYCKYNWISLLDVDDKWMPIKLEIQLPYMINYDIIGTQCIYFGNSNIIPNIPIGDLSSFDFIKVNPIINSSCLLKKELCNWDKDWDGVEDYNLWLKLKKQSKKFYNINSVQVMHRIHNESAFNAQGNHLKVKDLLTFSNCVGI